MLSFQTKARCGILVSKVSRLLCHCPAPPCRITDMCPCPDGCRGTLCHRCVTKSRMCPYGCDNLVSVHEIAPGMVSSMLDIEYDDGSVRCPHAGCGHTKCVSWTTTKRDDGSLTVSPCNLTLCEEDMGEHVEHCIYQPAMEVGSLLCPDILSPKVSTLRDQVVHMETCTKCQLRFSSAARERLNFAEGDL